MKLDVYDVLALAGGVILTIGLWMIYPPAAMIGLGLTLIGVGLAGARANAGGGQPTGRLGRTDK